MPRLNKTTGAEEYLFDESVAGVFGEEMFALAEELWPLNRSLTGDGNRATLGVIQSSIPELQLTEVPSGTSVFDWTIPPEWRIREGWIEDPEGKRICNFQENNLHVIGYSAPINIELDLQDLLPRIFSLPNQPDAIPYVTSYYSTNWGFCATDDMKKSLKPGNYRAFIDSGHFDGSLTYGEVVIPGQEDSEILLSTYICHPSMANNELSGIVLAQQLARWIKGIPNRRHTYRIAFLPETIGAIAFVSERLTQLKSKVIAGFVITCVGDERAYSLIPSRHGDSLADSVANAALRSVDPKFIRYTWQDRESDERQYCAPGVDLPVVSVMRSKYGAYPEYHTSLDKLGSVVTERGLAGSFLVYMRMIQMLELDCKPTITTLCEPQLGKRGLYPELGVKGIYDSVRLTNELIGNSDGQTSLIEMAENVGASFRDIRSKYNQLSAAGLLS